MALGTELERAAETVGQQEWLDPIADSVAAALQTAFSAAGPAETKITNFLHGTWLGHPLHPVLTDVPLGAWTTAMVLDVLEASGHEELGPGADAAVAVGLVGAVGAAVTGMTDWRQTDGRARRIGILHGLMNSGIALLYTGSYLLRRRQARGPARGLAALGYAAGLVSAYLGGHLVSHEQIGVDHTTDKLPPREFTPVMAESDLLEGRLTRVEAQGSPVLLLKHEGQVHALSEVCTHLGGPLSEGQLEGGAAQCPWHGSRFCVKDGRVLQGPATYPLPVFDVRIRDGQVEVRMKGEG